MVQIHFIFVTFTLELPINYKFIYSENLNPDDYSYNILRIALKAEDELELGYIVKRRIADKSWTAFPYRYTLSNAIISQDKFSIDINYTIRINDDTQNNITRTKFFLETVNYGTYGAYLQPTNIDYALVNSAINGMTYVLPSNELLNNIDHSIVPIATNILADYAKGEYLLPHYQ